jgi:hypothetical protein
MAINDAIFGQLYLDSDDFKARALSFGVTADALKYVTTPNDVNLISAIAVASRKIESVTARTFLPDQITEQHLWNADTHRIVVNQPPVLSLDSFQIAYGPQGIATFATNTIMINNQQNYLELTSLVATTFTLVPALIALGTDQPIVIVKYKSYQTVPYEIKAACGITAAAMINQAYKNRQIVPGVASIRLGDQQVASFNPFLNTNDYGIPSEAMMLLSRYTRIAIA